MIHRVNTVLLISILGAIGWASRRQPAGRPQPLTTGRYVLTDNASHFYIFDTATGVLHTIKTDKEPTGTQIFRIDVPKATVHIEKMELKSLEQTEQVKKK